MPATDLPAELFDVPANIPLMHQVVVAQLAAARQGTHKVKNRGEVSGSGKKPFKQKGTGRSRQGSVRAPEHTGGGVVHGPRPRSYAQRTPKKMIAAALLGALSDRARAGRVHVLELAGETPSTKAARIALADVRGGKRQLVVLGRDEIVAAKSVRNLAEVDVLFADQLNAYDVLLADDVVFTPAALAAFKSAKRVSDDATATAAQPTASAPAADQQPAATDALPASDARSTAGLEPDAAETLSTAPAEPVAVEPIAAEALADEPSTAALTEEESE